VITHRLPLSQMGEALAAIHRREAVKVILEP
jgi:threonine dehydrogenase-like Zn-dependent dehydrogenase